MMRPLPIAALAVTVLLAFSAAGPADAASKAQEFSAQKRQVSKQRPTTRVIVRRRSFLNAGTEVMPGERKFTDYVFGPNYSPTSIIDNTSAGGIRSPLPSNWSLPGWSRFP
jgi:hypothetical protein